MLPYVLLLYWIDFWIKLTWRWLRYSTVDRLASQIDRLAGISQACYISGVPGTGKTASVMAVSCRVMVDYGRLSIGNTEDCLGVR